MAESIKGFQLYQLLVMAMMRSSVERVMAARPDIGAESLTADVLGLPKPEHPAPDLTADESFAVELFQDVVRVSTAFQRLRDHEIYVRRFPFGDTSVARARHLHSVVVGYLQETYVFKERVKRTLNNIQRLYRPTRARRIVEDALSAQAKAFIGAVEGLMTIRGAHVHDRDLLDPNIDLVDSLDFVARVAEGDPFGAMARERADRTYRQARKEWRENMERVNDALEVLLDQVFDVVVATIFPEGEIEYPSAHL